MVELQPRGFKYIVCPPTHPYPSSVLSAMATMTRFNELETDVSGDGNIDRESRSSRSVSHAFLKGGDGK